MKFFRILFVLAFLAATVAFPAQSVKAAGEEFTISLTADKTIVPIGQWVTYTMSIDSEGLAVPAMVNAVVTFDKADLFQTLEVVSGNAMVVGNTIRWEGEVGAVGTVGSVDAEITFRIKMVNSLPAGGSLPGQYPLIATAELSGGPGSLPGSLPGSIPTVLASVTVELVAQSIFLPIIAK